jgi:hypothetical protein
MSFRTAQRRLQAKIKAVFWVTIAMSKVTFYYEECHVFGRHADASYQDKRPVKRRERSAVHSGKRQVGHVFQRDRFISQVVSH